MLDQKGFDLWADGYDKSVGLSDDSGVYPFAGYRRILGEIYSRVLRAPGRRVLDIGFGTATLTAKLYDAGCTIFGQDFSQRMLQLAQEKMPDAKLYVGDFTQGLARELLCTQYDAIIATYSLHHLTDDQKAEFLHTLLPRLAPGGRIYIGDVAFPDRQHLDDCRIASGEEWDDDEVYFVYDELRPHFPHSSFTPFSPCAGLLELWNDEPVIRECSPGDEATLLPLYQAVGWSNYTDHPHMLQEAFRHSLVNLGAYVSGRLVGLLRAVGDGASIVYIQDLLVHPEYQRQGIGRRLLQAAQARYSGVYQMLLSADNTADTLGFYGACGFAPLSELGCQSFLWTDRHNGLPGKTQGD